MKLVFVAPRFPYPLDRGDRLTVYNLLKHLSQRHQLYLICFTHQNHHPKYREMIEPFCEHIETVPLNKRRAYGNCLVGLAGVTPLQIRYYSDPVMRRVVARVINEVQPDVLYAHYIRMGRYIEPYRAIPRVLAMRLSMALNYRRLADYEPNWLYKTLYAAEYHKLSHFEAKFVRQFDKVLLISRHDVEAIASNGKFDNVFICPHGVDFNYFSPDPSIQKVPNTLIFTGNMKYQPNVEAARYFCQEVLPLVRNEISDIQLNIVGTSPTPEVLALADQPGVNVTGRVPDLRPYMNRSQLGIAPIRVASGLQNKVLEGMSMGLPMVITSMANEGIQAMDGQDVQIADSPQRFADHIVDLLSDPDRRMRIGRSARDVILRNWSWETHISRLEEMFFSLTDGKSELMHSNGGSLSNQKHQPEFSEL